MRRALIAVISGYRYLISPWLGQNCRFYPSCSCYAQQALSEHGSIKGLYLSFRRIMRCHPWHPGGYDPVPNIQVTDSSTSPQNHTGNCSHG
ncbi:MAG: membrane protein insertion efficiency factor YidD [Steroidobacteraceae bacterium]